MSTTSDFIEYVVAQAQIADCGEVRHRKMFGEYMVYVNDKPILLVCDNTVFVKTLPCLYGFMSQAEKGFPYDGAKEYYILDVDDIELMKSVVAALEAVIPTAQSKKKKEPKGTKRL